MPDWHSIQSRSCEKQNSTQKVSTQGPLMMGSGKVKRTHNGCQSTQKLETGESQEFWYRGPKGERKESVARVQWELEPGRTERGIEGEGRIYCYNVPEPGHLSREKAKKKDQPPPSPFLLSLVSALHWWPKATRNHPAKESEGCGVEGSALSHRKR